MVDAKLQRCPCLEQRSAPPTTPSHDAHSAKTAPPADLQWHADAGRLIAEGTLPCASIRIGLLRANPPGAGQLRLCPSTGPRERCCSCSPVLAWTSPPGKPASRHPIPPTRHISR